MAKLKHKLLEFISLDYRSLALMRIGMGVLIILDLIERSHSLVAHYTDAGVLSRADLLTLYGNQWHISAYMMNGSPEFTAILLIIAGAFAVMLMVGYRTMFVTIVSLFLLISLQDRNPMVLQGGDLIFRAILFWMLFLPTNKHWSLDRLFGRTTPPESKTTASPATVAYIVQVVLFYLFSGLLKTGVPWQDGSATYYALSVDQIARPIGTWIKDHFNFTKVLTYGSLYLETYGSLLYFSPVRTGLFRTVGVLLFAGLQIGINLSMHLGLFGAISIVATLGLLPSFFWDVALRRIAKLFGKKFVALKNYVRRFADELARHPGKTPLLVPVKNDVTKMINQIKNGVIIFLTVYIILWNVDTAGKTRIVPEQAKWIAWTTGLEQSFNMFAPVPLNEDGWYVFPGELKDGSQIDLLRDGPMLSSNERYPILYDKPRYVADLYPDQRWQKYLMNLWIGDNERYRLGYGKYLCRTWNKAHVDAEKLVTFKLIFMLEKTPLPGDPLPAAVPTTVWTHQCFDTPPASAMLK